VTVYRILLERSEVHEAAVHIDAESREEAEEQAKARAGDGFVAWTRVFEDVRVEASE
jgi:hypothetical protein